MKKIGIFGGTFNPIHKGHIKCIEEIDSVLTFDEILVIPDKLPPHKTVNELASDIDRLNMCRIAVRNIKKAVVSDIELKSKGKSYSVYTLRKLMQIYPKDKFRLFFIMGSDMLLCFEKWYEYKEILSICSLVCISRSDNDTSKLSVAAEKLRRIGGDVIIVNTDPLDISSSCIRERIHNSEDLSCFLDDLVVKYISENDVYNDK